MRQHRPEQSSEERVAADREAYVREKIYDGRMTANDAEQEFATQRESRIRQQAAAIHGL